MEVLEMYVSVGSNDGWLGSTLTCAFGYLSLRFSSSLIFLMDCPYKMNNNLGYFLNPSEQLISLQIREKWLYFMHLPA